MVHVEAMFTLTVFEILMFEGRSVLPPTQQDERGERLKNLIKVPKQLFKFL